MNNPTTTDDDLAQATNPTEALMPGLRAQFARMINAYVVATSVISDNYSIHGTGIVVDMDEPHEVTPGPGEFDGDERQRRCTGMCRSSAPWPISSSTEIASRTTTPRRRIRQLVAEAHYYRGDGLPDHG